MLKKINIFRPNFSMDLTKIGASIIAANAGIAVFKPIIVEEYPILFMTKDNNGKESPKPIPVAATHDKAQTIPKRLFGLDFNWLLSNLSIFIKLIIKKFLEKNNKTIKNKKDNWLRN